MTNRENPNEHLVWGCWDFRGSFWRLPLLSSPRITAWSSDNQLTKSSHDPIDHIIWSQFNESTCPSHDHRYTTRSSHCPTDRTSYHRRVITSLQSSSRSLITHAHCHMYSVDFGKVRHHHPSSEKHAPEQKCLHPHQFEDFLHQVSENESQVYEEDKRLNECLHSKKRVWSVRKSLCSEHCGTCDEK
jgi:hypothetical protein